MSPAPVDSGTPGERRARTLALILVLAAGAILRLYGTGEQLVLDDEWHAINQVVNSDYAGIASRFGIADHSIPLTLYYEWLSRGAGLSEWSMRAPMVLAGILAIVVFPWALRRWLSPAEQVLLATLIAFSPFLLFFSRLARPYALLVLLVGMCLPLAWSWWRNRRFGTGLAWSACAVLSAWMNPVTLAISLSPFVMFGFSGLARGWRQADWRPLMMSVALAGAMLLASAALLAWPLSQDFASLAAKSGRHVPDWRTLQEAVGLLTGTGHGTLSLVALLLAAMGAAVLWQRDRGFVVMLLAGFVASSGAVMATQADWIHQGIVPARYLSGWLPTGLMLAAMGVWRLARLAEDGLRNPVAAPLVCLALLGAWTVTGPVPGWSLASSQFVNHMSNQFDYNTGRNPIRRVFDGYEVDPVYAELSARHRPGEALVVEAPWYLESFWNPLHLHQAVHQQRVAAGLLNGICTTSSWGEIPADHAGLDFHTLIHVGDLVSGVAEADYLVLRRPRFDGIRDIDFDYPACVARLSERLGVPWRETPERVVFSLKNAGAAKATP